MLYLSFLYTMCQILLWLYPVCHIFLILYSVRRIFIWLYTHGVPYLSLGVPYVSSHSRLCIVCLFFLWFTLCVISFSIALCVPYHSQIVLCVPYHSQIVPYGSHGCTNVHTVSLLHGTIYPSNIVPYNHLYHIPFTGCDRISPLPPLHLPPLFPLYIRYTYSITWGGGGLCRVPVINWYVYDNGAN